VIFGVTWALLAGSELQRTPTRNCLKSPGDARNVTSRATV
jgi:hypothetical protein